MPRLPQPPSYFTGPAFQYLSQIAQAINGLPTVSYFTVQDPNGVLQGFDGDVAIYNGSASTLTRMWVNMSDQSNVPSFQSWQILSIGTASGGSGGGSTATAPVAFHFALSPDTTGNCYWQPQVSAFSTAIAKYAQVLSFGTGSVSSAQCIGILCPVSDPHFVLRTISSGASTSQWALRYYVGSAGSTGAPTSYTESLSGVNGANGGNYSVVTFTPTAGNISAGDVLQIEVGRVDGSNVGIGFIHTAHVTP